MAKHRYRMPQLPFGWRYQIEPVEDSEERAAGHLAASMRSQGLSKQAIADELNRQGYTNRRGEPYTNGSINAILAAVRRGFAAPDAISDVV